MTAATAWAVALIGVLALALTIWLAVGATIGSPGGPGLGSLAVLINAVLSPVVLAQYLAFYIMLGSLTRRIPSVWLARMNYAIAALIGAWTIAIVAVMIGGPNSLISRIRIVSPLLIAAMSALGAGLTLPALGRAVSQRARYECTGEWS